MDVPNPGNAVPAADSLRARRSWLPLARRAVLATAPALFTVVLGAILLAAIYFTWFDWQWVAFLSGILFAALLALASRSSRVEWLITRRNAQLNQLRQRLAQETDARRIAENAYRATEEKMRLLSDALPTMLIYVDANQRFRFHNRAYREWNGLREAQINGQLLRDVLGSGFDEEMRSRALKVLAGEQVSDEHTQTMANGATRRVRTTYLPHFDGAGRVIGFFGLIADAAEHAAGAAVSAPDAEVAAERDIGGRALVVTDASGQALYLKSMTEQLTGWDNPEARLRQALDRDEFRLYSQQIVAVADPAQPRPYYEILMRLQEEEDNLTPPGAFIPVAEHYNMTTQLDYWVVRNVISWHRRHRREAPYWQSSMYSINLFASTISDAGFSAFIQKQLAGDEMPPQVLCFEVSEDEAIKRLAATARLIADLRRIGCRVALGGFGGGKVSFDALKHLPVHFLKIDGSIIRDIENNPVNLAKVKAINRVSNVIGVQTIAQFVESSAVLKKLAEFGIDYAQGFGIGRPQPIERLIQ
ncbi:MAG TPA: EAL domain-containing protein [Burkholderiales bacterium]|nr:EAL domain-containing protein [Burkholderiales bacterium]